MARSDETHNTTIPYFKPPGDLDDLTAANRKIWSDQYINTWTNFEIEGNEEGPYGTRRTPLAQYFNPTKTPYDQSQNKIAITWRGFPNRIALQYQNREPLRWMMADASRLNQDEYLEWSLDRDPKTNKIISVQFTSEGPEYWQFIAETQPDTMIQLYKSLNKKYATEMVRSDFFLTNNTTGGTVYDPMNIWNQSSTSGTIAHLIHPSNQLSAEIDITAQATVQRECKGQLLTSSLDLINCSLYGNRARNSDPVIGGMVNKLAREGVTVTIADPVALYIRKFDTSTLRLAYSPTNMIPLPEGIVTWPRGEPPYGLRIHIEIPQDDHSGMWTSDEGRQLTVSDIYDTATKQYIQYGAQFADNIVIAVYGVGFPTERKIDPQACPCPPENSRDDLIGHRSTGEPQAVAYRGRRSGGVVRSR